MSLREPKKQRLILAGVFFLALGLVYYDRVYGPRARAMSALERQLAELELYRNASEGVLARSPLDLLERALAEETTHLGEWERMLASEDRLTTLLNSVSQQALSARVRVGFFQRSPPANEKFLVRHTFRLAVHGDYHQVGRFLALVGALPTLVVPANLTLTARPSGSPGGRMEARFDLQAYAVSPEEILPRLGQLPAR